MTEEETMDAGALREAMQRVVESWGLDDTCLRGDVPRFLDDVLAALAAAREPVAPAEAEPGLRAAAQAVLDSYDRDGAVAFWMPHLRAALAQPPAPVSAETAEAAEAARTIAHWRERVDGTQVVDPDMMWRDAEVVKAIGILIAAFDLAALRGQPSETEPDRA